MIKQSPLFSLPEQGKQRNHCVNNGDCVNKESKEIIVQSYTFFYQSMCRENCLLYHFLATKIKKLECIRKDFVKYHSKEVLILHIFLFSHCI